MNLYEIAKELEEKGYFPKYADFHLSVICAIIGQRIAFSRARKLRTNLLNTYEKMEEKESIEKLKKIDYVKVGCDKVQIERISEYLNNFKDWPNIKGIGKWTIKSITLITRSKGWKDIWLCEDCYVKQAINELKIKKKDFKEPGYISLLLWRVKKDSRYKLIRREKIDKIDLL
jgi:3-methyladenine DNA glycosylase/8-oxoguanine DNA glycosylase